MQDSSQLLRRHISNHKDFLPHIKLFSYFSPFMILSTRDGNFIDLFRKYIERNKGA